MMNESESLLENHMFRILVIALLGACGLAFAPVAHSQEKKGDDKAKPTIEHHGHSFFVAKSSKGTTVVFDPHLIPAYGLPECPKVNKADAILMSHGHNDHTQVRAVGNWMKAKRIFGLKGRGFRTSWNIVDTKVKDVRIRSIGLYHDEDKGMEFGKNTAFIVEMDGWKICHLGDVGHKLTERQLKEIGKVDVVMIPVGGIYTINGSQAKKIVDQLKPAEFVLPMHYGTKLFDEVLAPKEFLDSFPARSIGDQRGRTNKLVLDRNARRPQPMVVLLHYWPKDFKPRDQ